MLQMRIITVGKLKEPFLLQAQTEYLKRLQAYLKLEIIEVEDLPCPGNASIAKEEQFLQREGELIKRCLRPKDYLIVLDRQGKALSSVELAKFISERELNNEPPVLVIGGSLGLSPELLKMAQFKLSFSQLTFPHQLFRIMLLEQIYRCYKINRNEKYHK